MQVPESPEGPISERDRSMDDDWESKALEALVHRNRAWRNLAIASMVFALGWVAIDSWWPSRHSPLPADFVVELNGASAAELNLLPGIGPKSVDAILEFREANGGFTRIEELTRIPGIKEGKLRTLRPYVTVDPHYAKR